MQIDLRGCSFDQFVSFLFDHPVPIASTTPEDRREWYWNDVEVIVDPVLQLQHLTRLNSAPEFLLSRFTVDQLEQGFWLVFGPAGESVFTSLLWRSDVPWLLRESCILSMVTLFERLFSREPLPTASFMWWDLVVESDVYAHGDAVELSRGRAAILKTLERILALSSPACQRAALHGLNHLHELQAGAVVQRFLESHQDLDPELRAYAKDCLAGEAR